MRKALVAGTAVLAAACQFMSPNNVTNDLPMVLSNPPPIIDYDFSTYEAYYPLEIFEPSLEERLGFKDERGICVKMLGEGTGHEVPAYLIRANGANKADNPTALVVAPHGDEVGAWQAALTLSQATLEKGNMIVIPWLDRIAVEKRARYNYVGGADPNREFGAKQSGTYQSRIADDIKAMLSTGSIDLVINLHSAWGYYSSNNGNWPPLYLGQSIIVDTHELAMRAQAMLPEINKGLLGKSRFQVIMLESEQTLTNYCAFRNAPPVPAFAIETSKNMPYAESERISKRTAEILLKDFGIVVSDQNYLPINH
jgi:predicted deacylase